MDQVELRELEESLWRGETRFDRGYMDRVLHPDFAEFGRSGRVYSRAEILDTPASDIDARLPLPEYAAHLVAADVALVTYVGEVRDGDVVLRANRASLWLRHDGRWRLRFHQGTAIPD